MDGVAAKPLCFQSTLRYLLRDRTDVCYSASWLMVSRTFRVNDCHTPFLMRSITCCGVCILLNALLWEMSGTYSSRKLASFLKIKVSDFLLNSSCVKGIGSDSGYDSKLKDIAGFGVPVLSVLL